MRLIFLIILLIFTYSSYSQETNENKIKDINLKVETINHLLSLIKDTIPLMMESTEGGQMVLFRNDSNYLKKIIATYYGETGKIIYSFYISNNKLILCQIEETSYNRPIYYSEKVAKENNDSEVFNPEKSTVQVTNFYFDGTKNFLQLITDRSNRNCLQNDINMIINKPIEKYKELLLKAGYMTINE